MRNNAFSWIVLGSILVHLVVIGGLPMIEDEEVTVEPKRVKARIIAPKPKPIPPKPVVEKKPEPPPIEKPKPPEVKPKPVPKKKAQKRKGRKKRLPPKTLTVKKTSSAPVSTAIQPTDSNRVGSVLDLGDLDPDATDEELNRDFDADAEESDQLVEAIPEQKRQKDRKAKCKRCNKPTPPQETLALLPAELKLSISVRKDGTVSNVSIAKGIDPILDKEAKRIAMTWTFKPAIKNGVRVTDRVPMTVEFK